MSSSTSMHSKVALRSSRPSSILCLKGPRSTVRIRLDIDDGLPVQLRQHRRQLAQSHQGRLGVRRAAQHLHRRLAHAPAHAQEAPSSETKPADVTSLSSSINNHDQLAKRLEVTVLDPCQHRCLYYLDEHGNFASSGQAQARTW